MLMLHVEFDASIVIFNNSFIDKSIGLWAISPWIVFSHIATN